MTDFEKTYQNYNPRQTALDEARALLTAAARAAMADGTLPEAELPAFIVEIPADVKNGDIASNIAMAGARTWRKAPKMIADALIAHLPALDGGRLVFLIIELIRGKRIDPEKEGMVHFVGLMLLMLLMVVVMFNDVRKIFF